jgi:putative glycerol-1-phosphate prenyltransferase
MNEPQTTFERLLKIKHDRGAGYLVLVDPDKMVSEQLPSFVHRATEAGVDGFLVGGSLLHTTEFDEHIKIMKRNTTLPVVIFPGSLMQVSPNADALLFLMLISGRNAEHLIGNQVIAAPVVKKMGLEAISTGYMIVESDTTTSVEFMSNTKPIPRSKPDIALAHALAAEIIGMRILYLDAGSGANQSVPDDMIALLTQRCSLPLIVGGGIRRPEEARRKVEAGASFVVTGTINEEQSHPSLMKEFANAVHLGSKVNVR